jgi:DNA polymerase-3 subunit chi
VTKVSFYILAEESLEARARFAVKFVRQSFRKGLDVYCHVASASEAEALDQLLWDDEESFIPHEVEQDDSPKAPVGIGWQNPTDRHGVLVNLGGDTAPMVFTLRPLSRNCGARTQGFGHNPKHLETTEI